MCLFIPLTMIAPSTVEAGLSFGSIPSSGEVQISDETAPDGTPGIRAVFWMEAEADVVYQTLRDSQHFPEFMPDTRKVFVLESGPDYQIACFSGVVGFINSDLTLKRVYDDTTRRISWSLISGLPREMTGFWLVEKDPHRSGSFVMYTSYVAKDFWFPDGIVRGLLRNNINKTAASLRKRVESGGNWKSEEYLRRER